MYSFVIFFLFICTFSADVDAPLVCNSMYLSCICLYSCSFSFYSFEFLYDTSHWSFSLFLTCTLEVHFPSLLINLLLSRALFLSQPVPFEPFPDLSFSNLFFLLTINFNFYFNYFLISCSFSEIFLHNSSLTFALNGKLALVLSTLKSSFFTVFLTYPFNSTELALYSFSYFPFNFNMCSYSDCLTSYFYCLMVCPRFVCIDILRLADTYCSIFWYFQ